MPIERTRRGEIGFALGNLVPALVLGASGYALPVRFWPVDALFLFGVVALIATSGLALARAASARPALRIGAMLLLVVGLVLVAAAVLSLAFLSGVHGDFGRGGMLLMLLVALLVLPYTVVYPALELYWLGPGPPPKSPAAPPPATATAPETEAGGAGA